MRFEDEQPRENLGVVSETGIKFSKTGVENSRDRKILPSQASCDVTIAGSVTRAILDTGSAKTIIRADYAKDLIRQGDAVISQSHAGVNLVSAGGDKLFTDGIVVLDLAINGSHFSCPFIVVTNLSFKIILGMDFFLKYKVDLIFSDKILRIKELNIRATLFPVEQQVETSQIPTVSVGLVDAPDFTCYSKPADDTIDCVNDEPCFTDVLLACNVECVPLNNVDCALVYKIFDAKPCSKPPAIGQSSRSDKHPDRHLSPESDKCDEPVISPEMSLNPVCLQQVDHVFVHRPVPQGDESTFGHYGPNFQDPEPFPAESNSINFDDTQLPLVSAIRCQFGNGTSENRHKLGRDPFRGTSDDIGTRFSAF